MNVLIKSATIVDTKSDFHNQTLDVLIEKGVITQISKSIKILKTIKKLKLKIFIFLKVGLIVV